jgi:hypothetical protein
VKEQWLWRHNTDSLEGASQALKAWFGDYNDHGPHQALKIKTPRQMRHVTAQPCSCGWAITCLILLFSQTSNQDQVNV